MALVCVRLSDAHPEGQLVVEPGVHQVDPPRTVDGIQDPLVDVISPFVPEADQVQRCRCRQLKLGILLNPTSELLGEPDVMPDMMAQSFDAIVTDDEPELESSKASPQRHLPVSVIYHGPAFAGRIPQVFRKYAQCADQIGPSGHPEAIAIEIHEHPFVRVEAIAVGSLEPAVDEAKFRANRRRPAHRCVDVKPNLVVLAELPDGLQGVERI